MLICTDVYGWVHAARGAEDVPGCCGASSRPAFPSSLVRLGDAAPTKLLAEAGRPALSQQNQMFKTFYCSPRCRAGVAAGDYLKPTASAFPQAEWWDLNVKLFFGLVSAGFSPLFFSLPFLVCGVYP